MTSSDLFAASFTIQTNTTGVPLWAALKRYTKENPAVQKTQSGCVLIFAHGIGLREYFTLGTPRPDNTNII